MQRASQTIPSKIAQYKKGIEPEKCRRSRDAEALAMRRQKREIRYSQSRNIIPTVILDGVTYDFCNLESEERLIDVLSSMRRVLSDGRDDLVNQVYENGILHHFHMYLTPAFSEEVQFQSAWILTNITSSVLFDAVLLTYVEPLVNLFIRSPYMNVRIQSLWAITNIIGSIDIMKELSETTFFECLVLLASTIQSEEFLKIVSWSIFAILRNDTAKCMIPYFISTLRKILSEATHEEIIINIEWCLYNITSSSETYYESLMNAGIIPILMHHLGSKKGTIVYSTIRVLANFAMGDTVYTEEMIKYGFLERVRDLLIMESGYDIQKECCWALSNIIAGSKQDTEQIISGGFLPILSSVFDKTYTRVQGEIVYIVWNILVRQLSRHAEEVINSGLIYPLIVYLERKNIDLVKVSLDSFLKLFSTDFDKSETLQKLNDILDEYGFKDIIDQLCYSDVPEIAESADDILKLWSAI